jgi:hypothetical protein
MLLLGAEGRMPRGPFIRPGTSARPITNNAWTAAGRAPMGHRPDVMCVGHRPGYGSTTGLWDHIER